MATADKSLLSRGDHVRLKIDQLEELKRQMRAYDGNRLAKLRREPGEEGNVDREEHEDASGHRAQAVEAYAHGGVVSAGEAGDVDREPHEEAAKHEARSAEHADAGDKEYGAERVDAREDGEEQPGNEEWECPHCGKEIDAGVQVCPHCDGDIKQEGGGAEDGRASDVAERERDVDDEDAESEAQQEEEQKHGADADRVAEVARRRMKKG